EHDLKDFQFVFIELPKFPKNKEEQLESIVDRWLFFFKYADETTEEDLRKIAEKAPIIKLAYDELDRFSWNEKDLVAYEERIMDLRKEEGILAKKLDEGKIEGKIEVAKNLLKADISIDIISQTTGLPQAEIKRLQEEIT
ncbi:MAG: Rpn family recombination-promoting nuclease/putative transposase, partial [Wolbachia endosymbiont of Andrena apicata]|nr:Rpn family recombination-promoting nuclease/putative transposase [Wolbachia endosymbiont of Andrena apicata]